MLPNQCCFTRPLLEKFFNSLQNMDINNDPQIASKRSRIDELKRQVADLRALAEAEAHQERRTMLLSEVRDHMRTILALEREIREIVEGWNSNLAKALFILENRQ